MDGFWKQAKFVLLFDEKRGEAVSVAFKERDANDGGGLEYQADAAARIALLDTTHHVARHAGARGQFFHAKSTFDPVDANELAKYSNGFPAVAGIGTGNGFTALDSHKDAFLYPCDPYLNMKVVSRKWLTYKSYSYLRLIRKSLQMDIAMTTLRPECLSSTASSFDAAFARFNQRGSALAKAPELQLSLAAFRRASHYANFSDFGYAFCV